MFKTRKIKKTLDESSAFFLLPLFLCYFYYNIIKYMEKINNERDKNMIVKIIAVVFLLYIISVPIIKTIFCIKDFLLEKKIEKLRCNKEYDLAEKEWKDWKSKEDILQDDLNILNQCEKIFYKNGKIELSKEIKEMIKTTEDKLSKTHDKEREYYQKFSQIQERVWKTI